MQIRIRIQQLKLMRIHADPDTDPDPKPGVKYTYAQAEVLTANNKKKFTTNFFLYADHAYFKIQLFISECRFGSGNEEQTGNSGPGRFGNQVDPIWTLMPSVPEHLTQSPSVDGEEVDNTSRGGRLTLLCSCSHTNKIIPCRGRQLLAPFL
jgi:hypothetical protein